MASGYACQSEWCEAMKVSLAAVEFEMEERDVVTLWWLMATAASHREKQDPSGLASGGPLK